MSVKYTLQNIHQPRPTGSNNRVEYHMKKILEYFQK